MAFESGLSAAFGATAQADTASAGLQWESLGLVLAIVGCFLLANGVLLRDPRALVAQHFGRTSPALGSVRELLFHRVQTALGFLFLIAGFALQLWGHARPDRAGGDLPGSTALWVGAIVVISIGLEGVGWWWSLRTFRRHVGAYLRAAPPDLASDVQLAREVGELYGVRSHGDDTVEAYLERVRAAVGLQRPVLARPRGGTRERELDELSETMDTGAREPGVVPPRDLPRRA